MGGISAACRGDFYSGRKLVTSFPWNLSSGKSLGGVTTIRPGDFSSLCLTIVLWSVCAHMCVTMVKLRLEENSEKPEINSQHKWHLLNLIKRRGAFYFQLSHWQGTTTTLSKVMGFDSYVEFYESWIQEFKKRFPPDCILAVVGQSHYVGSD